jgi:hypothetical protein
MIGTSSISSRKLLAFSAVLEIATGVALLAVPSVVVSLLLGDGFAAAGVMLGRFFGIALIALGLACWPTRQGGRLDSPALRGMLLYNALVALYLGYLGAITHRNGLLLWPAVALHAAIFLLLLRSRRRS